METIDAILAVDWVQYASAAVAFLVAVVTAADVFVQATPSKWDDKNVGPFIKSAKALFARFSLFRGSR